jgi:hypothetical protein
VRYHADGEAYELWVHGLRDRVHAQDSPVRRFATTLARDARAALDADRLDACIDALVRLGEIDPESGEGRALSSSVADAVVARARTGAVAEARVLAERAGRLAWPECGARIREAEKRLGQSLAPRSIAERLDLARRSLAEQRFDKAGEHLAAVATLEPTNAQALALLDDALARARERHDRGSPGDLAALTKRLSNTPWSGRIPSARSEATGASRWLAASIVVALLGIALALAGHAHGRIAVTGMVAALEASALVATRRSPNARPAHVSIAALVAWVAVVAWSWHGPG